MTDIFRTYQVRLCIPVLVHENKKIRSIVLNLQNGPSYTEHWKNRGVLIATA